MMLCFGQKIMHAVLPVHVYEHETAVPSSLNPPSSYSFY